MTPRQIAYRSGITKLTPKRLKAASALAKRGYSNRQIAALFEVDESLVRRRLKGAKSARNV